MNIRKFTVDSDEQVVVKVLREVLDLYRIAITDEDAAFDEELSDKYGSPVLRTKGEPKFTLIPYFAFANRGGDEMKVWIKTT